MIDCSRDYDDVNDNEDLAVCSRLAADGTTLMAGRNGLAGAGGVQFALVAGAALGGFGCGARAAAPD